MGRYLYCVGASDHAAVPLPRGVDGSEVRVAEAAGLRLWVSELEKCPAASLARIREHNAVIEAVAEEDTPLPVRYGQWFESPESLAASIEARRASLVRGLDRVRGAVEYGVRLRDAGARSPEPPDRSSGRAYLEGLARRREEESASPRRLEAVAEALRTELGDVVREQRVRGGETAELAVAHLVARHDTGTYGDRLRRFDPRGSAVRLVFSGPWPPYGFVDDGP